MRATKLDISKVHSEWVVSERDSLEGTDRDLPKIISDLRYTSFVRPISSCTMKWGGILHSTHDARSSTISGVTNEFAGGGPGPQSARV